MYFRCDLEIELDQNILNQNGKVSRIASFTEAFNQTIQVNSVKNFYQRFVMP